MRASDTHSTNKTSSSQKPTSQKPTVQKVMIAGPAGELEVEALWQQGDPQDASTDTVALLCHPNPLDGGTMNNKVVTTMQRFARDEGMHTVRFNFRCTGQSTGEHDYGVGEIEDAMAVLQWVHQQTNATQLWLGGFSFGGYVIAKVAEQMLVTPHIWGLSDMDVVKVVLIAPSVEKNDVSDLTLPTAKTLMIYGDDDHVIPPASMQKFAQDQHIQTHIIHGAGHLFHGFLTEIKDVLDTDARR